MKTITRFSLYFSLYLSLFALSSCGSTTRFKDLNKHDSEPESKNIAREIASESPVSLGCHRLIEDILYLKEQREAKEAEKKRRALEALK